MEIERETEEPSSTGNLVAALEQATLMAKQIPTTTDPSQLFQILTALSSAHHHLSLVLSKHQALPPPTSYLPQPPENSVSSVMEGGSVEENDENADPMVMGDDEQNSRAVEKVASRMRDCFIQNKRPKRMLSPSPEMRRRYEDVAEKGDVEAVLDYSVGYKFRALDLIYQFHA